MHGTVRLNVWEEQYRLCSRVFGGPFQGSQLSNDPPVGYLISRKTKTYNYFWERSKKCGYSSISFQGVHITFGYRVSYADRDSNSCCKVETFPSQIRISQNLNTYFYGKSEINCNKLLSVCNRIILYLLQSCTQSPKQPGQRQDKHRDFTSVNTMFLRVFFPPFLPLCRSLVHRMINASHSQCASIPALIRDGVREVKSDASLL